MAILGAGPSRQAKKRVEKVRLHLDVIKGLGVVHRLHQEGQQVSFQDHRKSYYAGSFA